MHPEEKRTHVKAWQTSGQTKAAYARQHGINSKTFGRWCLHYQPDTTKNPGLASVSIETSPGWLGELLKCLV